MTNVTVRAAIWAEDFFREALIKSDLRNLLCCMHDCFLKHNVEDQPDIRKEVKFLLDALDENRKTK